MKFNFGRLHSKQIFIINCSQVIGLNNFNKKTLMETDFVIINLYIIISI